jgi:hypothetical protein
MLLKKFRTDKPKTQPRQGVKFQYYQAATQQTARKDNYKQKKLGTTLISLKGKLRLLPTWIALLVIIFSFIASSTLTHAPKVVLALDQTPLYRPIIDYEKAASEEMGRSLGSVSKLTIQTGKIEAALLERFPEIQAVAVKLPVLGRKPTLLIALYKPAAVLRTGTNSYILNQKGQIIASTAMLDDQLLGALVTIDDESGLEATISSQVVTTSTITFVQAVVAQLTAQSISIASLALPPTPNQLDVRVQDTPYLIKMNISGDARLQAGSYISVREALAREGVVPAEYIDVRVEEKVFYK